MTHSSPENAKDTPFEFCKRGKKWGVYPVSAINDGVDYFIAEADTKEMAARIVAALNAPAQAAGGEPYDPSPYCTLDACRREGCTRLAHMCISKQPTAPAAPPQPTLATEECARIAESHVGMRRRPIASDASEAYDEACRDIAKAIRDAAPAVPQGSPDPVDIGNAIIAGVASGDGPLEQMNEIVSHLERAGFEIRPAMTPAIPQPARCCAHLWVCSGCGTRKSMEQIKGEAPQAIACCPERHMVPPLSRPDTTEEQVEIACEAYADATNYYVKFHRGLSSPSADIMRKGMRAALSALSRPKCATCGDRGEVGGFVNAENGYQTDPCPDCGALPSQQHSQGE